MTVACAGWWLLGCAWTLAPIIAGLILAFTILRPR
jgi:hypothetical protein